MTEESPYTPIQLGVPPDHEPADAVTVAYLHQNDVTYSWHHSMVGLIGYDMANAGRVLSGGYIAMRCGTDGLVEARNKAVRHFLDDTRAAWLFWIDTDMGFPVDTVERLLDAADAGQRPIVGALCFAQRETTSDDMGGWRTSAIPTIFDWVTVEEQGQDRSGFAVRWDYPGNTVLRCSGTGSACILIHRSVFERIEERFGPHWYDRIPNPSTAQIVAEDLSFCMRALALAIPVYVHTGVVTTHAKRVWVQEEDYWRQRAIDPTPVSVVPVKRDEVAVDA